MKLSTKGRYAITAIMAVAIGEKTRPVTLAEISEEQGISISYLEQIFARLRKHQIVKGTRGPGGGYCLSRATNEISIADIIIAVEDQLRVQKPIGNGQSNQRSDVINTVWDNLSRKIHTFLGSVTLSDLLNDQAAGIDEIRIAPRLTANAGKRSWAN